MREIRPLSANSDWQSYLDYIYNSRHTLITIPLFGEKALSVQVEQKNWEKASHEHHVESFYGWGVENYGDFHNGYLNFGLWEEGKKTYLEAAENMVHRMATLAGVGPNSNLMDVGCGMGTQDIYIMKTFNPRTIDAVDVTWKHIEHSRRRAKAANLEDRITYHHGTAVKVPFPDQNFTNVMSIEAPEHFNTRQKFLQEAYRVLKPGGIIGLADYTLKRPPKNIIEKFVVDFARRMWKVPLDNVYSTQEYHNRMKQAGFRNVEIQEVGALTIPGYFYEQKRPEVIEALTRIRGFVAGRLGFVIDIAVFQAFQRGLLEYVLVHAEK